MDNESKNLSPKRKVSPLIGIALIITLVILSIPFLTNRNQKKASPTPSETPAESATPSVTPANIVEGEKVKKLTVEGGNFSFTPDSLTVNEGDTVIITFKNTQGIHDLTINEYNVGTKQLKSGEEETIQFIASKKGTFEYYCSVTLHRQLGMVGTLTVL